MFEKLNSVKSIIETKLGTAYYKRKNKGLVHQKNIKTLERKNSSILYLCYGNICRSPFAERYTKQIISDQSFSVLSSGFHKKGDRKSPKKARKAAKEFGVDLSSHRSEIINPEVINNADIIFIMDYKNLYHLFSDYEVNPDLVYFLGQFSNVQESEEIVDPYDSSFHEYIEVYEQITDAVDEIVNILEVNN